MPLFRMQCPKCHQAVLLGARGACENKLKDGSKCRFSLPIRYEDGNAKYRRKMEKHTTSVGLGATGTYSWVDASGTYPFCQQAVMEQGSLHLDASSNYLFLWTTPSGDGPLATVLYGSAGSITTASGVVMPLNSKPQNLHHFYDNYQPNFQRIAEGTGLEIQAPDGSHPDYQVYRSVLGVSVLGVQSLGSGPVLGVPVLGVRPI